MTANDLLDILGAARAEYILAADAPVEKKRLPRRKLLLIAAIVAVMLVLAGCTAVFLWLNDRSIGQETYTQRFDAEGHYIEPTEKTADVVTLFGSGGSNMQKALVEWIEYRHNYPDAWDLDLTEEEYEVVPERYRYTYDCYTMEMVEELERIATKYGLKVLDTELSFQRYQYKTALEGAGLTSILRPDAKATMEDGQGDIRLPGNLYIEFFMDLTGIEAKWAKQIYVNYSYAQADYFPGFGTRTMDLNDYQQWKYTAADGTPLLLALNRKGEGLILAERKDAMIWIDVDSNMIGPNFPKPEEVIDQKGFEQLADAFDYSIKPKAVDAEGLRAKLDAEYEAQMQKMRDEIKTYAGFTDYLLKNGHLYSKWDYTLLDLDGDGTKEMVLYDAKAPSHIILHMHEGKCREHLAYGSDFLLLENGGTLSHSEHTYEEEGKLIYYHFHPPKANGYPLTFHYDDHFAGATTEDTAVSVIYRENVWKKCVTNRWDEGTIISEEEAQEIVAQYPLKKLDWQPLWDYPVDAEGTTLGQVLSERKNPTTWEEGLEFYSAANESGELLHDLTQRKFTLRDVNGDGAIDLVLSPDGEEIREIYVSRYGKAAFWTMSQNYLCEDGVLLSHFINNAKDGADVEAYTYYKLTSTFAREVMIRIELNKANGQWTNVTANTPITEAEAQAIIAEHPTIALDFRPISELIG